MIPFFQIYKRNEKKSNLEEVYKKILEKKMNCEIPCLTHKYLVQSKSLSKLLRRNIFQKQAVKLIIDIYARMTIKIVALIMISHCFRLTMEIMIDYVWRSWTIEIFKSIGYLKLHLLHVKAKSYWSHLVRQSHSSTSKTQMMINLKTRDPKTT